MSSPPILLYMGVTALFMAAFPSGYFEVVKLVGGIPLATSTPALLGLVGISALMMFAVFLFLCYQAQSNCKTKSFKTVAVNAGIATAIQTGLLLVGLFVPGLRDLISKYFLGPLVPAQPGGPAAPGTDEAVRAVAVDAGFWGAWGAAYGIAVGVTMAGSC
jgi:hypothetical protein